MRHLSCYRISGIILSLSLSILPLTEMSFGADWMALEPPPTISYPCSMGPMLRMQRTSAGLRRVPLPPELVPVVRHVQHDTAGVVRVLEVKELSSLCEKPAVLMPEHDVASRG